MKTFNITKGFHLPQPLLAVMVTSIASIMEPRSWTSYPGQNVDDDNILE